MENAAQVPFVSRQIVYFDMLDALFVLYNANYLVLFERARMDFIATERLPLILDGSDWPYFVVRTEVNYHAPITKPQIAQVTVGIARLGRTSLTFAQSVITEDGTLAAEGQTTIVRIDAATRRPTPWSDAFRARIAPYLLPKAGV